MRVGVRLLLTRDEDEARSLASTLNALNGERRNIEADMLEKAVLRAEYLLAAEEPRRKHPNRRVLCLLDADGHEGVVGLVAGRVKEATGLPTLVFAPASDPDFLKGSARSVPNVHIRDILAEVHSRYPDMIQSFGGHAMAAGLTIRRDLFEKFDQVLQLIAVERIPEEALNIIIWTDGAIEPEFFSLDLARELEENGPYGNSFAPPIFEGVFHINKAERIGSDLQTLRLSLSIGPTEPPITAIKFRHGDAPDPAPGSQWNVVYVPTVNRYRDRESLQVMIQHLWAVEAG